jgi:plastocyanin
MNRSGIRCTAALTILVAGLLAAGCGSSSSSGTSTSAPATTATSASTASSSAATPTATTGGAAPGATTGAAQVLTLAANPSGALSYNTTTLHAKPGKVTIVFTNTSPLSHNVTVESSAGAKLGTTPIFTGGVRSLTLDLKAGTYTFFCAVPGHRQAGMQGTLTVG